MVTVSLGEQEVTLIDSADSVMMTFEYGDMTGMAKNSDIIKISTIDKPVTLQTQSAEVLFQTVKAHIVQMQEVSNYAVAMGNHFVGANDPEVLSFKKEDAILITNKSDATWWRGSLVSEPNVVSQFPKDIVYLLCGPMKSLDTALFQISV